MDEIDQIVDIHGNTRRLGSLLPPQGFVSAFKTYEAEHPLYTDAEIRRIITDPNRTPRRKVFGDKWIMDQKSHGSCNGFAAAGALSKARALRGINDGLLLSGAFCYSTMNDGRDNGSVLEDGLLSIQKIGICPASLVTWDMIYPRQQPPNAKAEAAKHKGLACYAVQTRQGFRSALAAGFPCIVAVHAGNKYQSPDSNGICGADNGIGNHSVHCDDICIVGAREVYDQAGSWNTTYAVKGRGYLTWDSFEQTFGRHTFYAIGSTEERD